MAFQGTEFYPRLSPEEQKEIEIRVSAWRLSQFLHGEQGALLVASQLVNPVPELDCKLYASTQVVDEGRHVEVFEKYVKKLHKIYPVDPLLKGLIDEILTSPHWELKLLGMQMLIEGLAIAAFNVMHKQTGDPTLAPAPGLRAPGRGPPRELRLLRPPSGPSPTWRPRGTQMLEDFALRACDSMFARDERTGFQSIRDVWREMGWHADAVWRDTMTNSMTAKAFNRFLFTEVLIPRLQRLGLISPRVETAVSRDRAARLASSRRASQSLSAGRTGAGRGPRLLSTAFAAWAPAPPPVLPALSVWRVPRRSLSDGDQAYSRSTP